MNTCVIYNSYYLNGCCRPANLEGGQKRDTLGSCLVRAGGEAVIGVAYRTMEFARASASHDDPLAVCRDPCPERTFKYPNPHVRQHGDTWEQFAQQGLASLIVVTHELVPHRMRAELGQHFPSQLCRAHPGAIARHGRRPLPTTERVTDRLTSTRCPRREGGRWSLGKHGGLQIGSHRGPVDPPDPSDAQNC